MNSETQQILDGTGVPPVPAELNVFSPAWRDDPFPAYRRLRAAAPLYRSGRDTYLVTRYDDCASILQDPDWGHGYEERINPFRPGVDPDGLPGSFLRMDPPDHTRLRALVSRAFTPRIVAALRPRIERAVDELLDTALRAGEVDLMAALAYPLPIGTICEMLGVPVRDYPVFHEWACAITRGLDPDTMLSAGEIAARDEAMAGFAAYFTELIARRRAEPRDDLLSGLAAAEDRGDVLSEHELLGICVLLLVAGYETTVNLIAGGVLALARNPGQLARLRAEPELAPRAVEEFLRYDPPVPFPTRVALTDVVLAGRRLPRGSGVVLLIGSANRDPAAFAEPDRLDLTRYGGPVPVPRHLAFSRGAHYCLGAELARVEASIAFEGLIRRAPGFQLLVPEPAYRPNVSMRGPATLPVRLRGPA